MIEEKAVVVDVFAGKVLIEPEAITACGQCQSNKSCGQKGLSEWASSKMTRIEIDNPDHLLVAIGDKVVVGVDEGSFLKASASLYLLPLLTLVTGAGLSDFIFKIELVTIVVAFLSLFAGLVLARFLGTYLERHSQYKPVLLRIS